jgi:hypothetical protein
MCPFYIYAPANGVAFGDGVLGDWRKRTKEQQKQHGTDVFYIEKGGAAGALAHARARVRIYIYIGTRSYIDRSRSSRIAFFGRHAHARILVLNIIALDRVVCWKKIKRLVVT